MSEPLPDFRAPPVSETVLGIQFELLPKFTNGHAGRFWTELGGDWTEAIDAPPLLPEMERFGKDRVWMQLGDMSKFTISTKPTSRLQIHNAAGDRMLQVQNGRLHYNWIGSRGVEYARYNTVRAEFLDKVDQFKGFLAKTGVGELRVNQWEVTYVNNLPAGSVWATPDQWNDVFSAQIALPARLPNSRLESLAGVWTYEIEPQRGRLHVEIQHGRTSSTSMSQDLLVFRLTARGPVSSGAKEFVTGLDLGHETIVRSFKALTSDTARKEWGEL